VCGGGFDSNGLIMVFGPIWKWALPPQALVLHSLVSGSRNSYLPKCDPLTTTCRICSLAVRLNAARTYRMRDGLGDPT